MNILAIQALRGPNYWSISNPKLFQLRLEIVPQEVEFNFDEIRNHVSVVFHGINGVQNTNNLYELTGLLALHLQRLCGLTVDFLLVNSTKYPNINNVVYEYGAEETGKLAGKMAVELLNGFLKNKQPDIVGKLEKLNTTLAKEMYPEAVMELISEAKQLQIPVLEGDTLDDLQFGYGLKSTKWDKVVTSGFNKDELYRIPLIAITGSNGKTTTTRLTAFIASLAGKNVGFTTSDGIYIKGKMVDEGDTTGPMSAGIVLRNNEVDFAVLETARGGIVRAGLGFDQCDVGVITNIQEDHLGISDIETISDLANVKYVVTKAIKPGGFAVLNGDNSYSLNAVTSSEVHKTCFTLNLPEFLKKANSAVFKTIAYVENGDLKIKEYHKDITICKVTEIPITFGGTVEFMLQNAMAASLAAWVSGIDIKYIRKGLLTFVPSAETTPGRMNIFKLRDYTLLVDFAHNQDGFAGVRDYLKTVEAPFKAGIIVATGDRKPEDVIQMGAIAAQMFDKIYIHQVKFLRGSTAENLIDLLLQGFNSISPSKPWERIPDALEPLSFVINQSAPGTYIVALSNVLNDIDGLVKQYS